MINTTDKHGNDVSVGASDIRDDLTGESSLDILCSDNLIGAQAIRDDLLCKIHRSQKENHVP